MLPIFISYLVLVGIISGFYWIARPSKVSYRLQYAIYDLECGDLDCDCVNWGVCSRYTGFVVGMSDSEMPLILGTKSRGWKRGI